MASADRRRRRVNSNDDDEQEDDDDDDDASSVEIVTGGQPARRRRSTGSNTGNHGGYGAERKRGRGAVVRGRKRTRQERGHNGSLGNNGSARSTHVNS